ncbi:MAG: hypothetical protein NVS9B4_06080 [Candidatus Acidiferrum sp.]
MVAKSYGAIKDAAKVYEVKYTPETLVIGEDAVKKQLRKMSDDGATFDFNSSSEEAKNLKPGSVLLLSGVALRKVTEVMQTGEGIEVKTDPAELTDAIQNGKIEAKYDVDFGSVQSNPVFADNVRDPFSLMPIAYADTTQSQVLSGATDFDVRLDPFTYKVKFTPSPNQLNIQMSIEVTDSHGVLKVNGKGYLKNFHSTVQMLIQDSKVSDFNFNNSGLSGEMEFSWQAANAVAGPMTKLASWPQEVLKNVLARGAAFRIPFMIGPIPFTLKFTTGVSFTPAFSSKNGLCKGSVKVSFSGDGGFQVSHGSASPVGSVSQTGDVDPASAIVSLGPVGFTVAIELPRIELDLGINPFGLVPGAFLNVVSSYGSVAGGAALGGVGGLVGMMPCQTHFLDLTINAGMTAQPSPTMLASFASFLGTAPKAKISTLLFEKKLKTPGKSGMMCIE